VKSAHSAKLDSIQGLRALAVLLVIAYHYDFPIKNGFVGVDVFFVISGFVITQSLVRNRTNSRRKDLTNFYIKRIARLFPAFIIVFLFTMLAIFLVYSPNIGVQQNAIKGSLGAMLALSNFAIPRISGGYFEAGIESNPFLHTWSLSVEEQFYFIYPLLFFFLIWLNTRRNSKRLQNLILSLIILFSFLMTINVEPLSKLSSLGTLTYFAPQARMWEFLLGAIVALNPIGEKSTAMKKLKPLSVATISFIIIFSVAFQFDPDTSLFVIAIPVCSAAIFLAICGTKSHDEFQICKRENYLTKIPVHLGNLSYSLYLWHWPIYVTALIMFPNHKLGVALFSIPLTYALSLITYKYVETRFNSSTISSKKFWVLTLGTGQLISCFIFFILFLGSSKGWNQDWALNTNRVISRGCDAGDIDFKRCYWGDNATAIGSVYLVGDSMASSIAESVIEGSLKEGLGIQILVRNSCSITELANYSINLCGAWRREVVEILSDKRPDLIVIANSNAYPEHDLLGVGNLIANLNREGTKVLLILPPPGGDSFSERRALAYSPGGANRNKGRPDAISLVKYGLESYLNPKLFQVYDPANNLCSKDFCVIAKNGKDYYTSGAHLSIFANRVLGPTLKINISRLLNN
jgi:peptidoglycan/LPS O-acetylase OafA/YrhL